MQHSFQAAVSCEPNLDFCASTAHVKVAREREITKVLESIKVMLGGIMGKQGEAEEKKKGIRRKGE